MKAYSDYKKYKSALISSTCPISYHNFWDGQSADEIWFTGFLRDRGFLSKYPNAHFSFFSNLGDVHVLRVDEMLHPINRHWKRIFFTGENIHYEVFSDYENHLLDHKSIDIALGFDAVDDERYLRFPLWILEMFPPQSSANQIFNICNALSHQKLENTRNRFCAMVAGGGASLLSEHLLLRKSMVDSLSIISKVDCAGRFLRNTDDLQTLFNDDKAEFLKCYKFFICPENTSVEGYVTEKVFHSIGSGCIPIYRGSLNNPEPDVLNHDAILFWEKDADNAQLIKNVDELWNNPNLYKEFFEQSRLLPTAWEVVAYYFDSLEQKIHEICRNS